MTNDWLEKLKAPAIGLIITAVVNILYGLYAVISAIIKLSQGLPETAGMDDARKAGFYVGFIVASAIAALSMIIAPFIIYGAVQMMKGKSYSMSKTASVLAVVPLTSCCFILGAPFGIWALVMLGKPEIKNIFQK